MKLSIKYFGPVKQAVVDFKRINVLVGPQSSGKSTILKIASFCNWIEKHVQLTQSPGDWVNPDVVKYHLFLFHKLDGYAYPGSVISYKSDTLQFKISFDKNLLIGTHLNGLISVGIIDVQKTPISLQRGTLLRLSRIGSM